MTQIDNPRKYPPNQEVVEHAVEHASHVWGGTWLPRFFLENEVPEGYTVATDFQIVPETSAVGDGVVAIYYQSRCPRGDLAHHPWELICRLTAIEEVTFTYDHLIPTCDICHQTPYGLSAGCALATELHELYHLNP